MIVFKQDVKMGQLCDGLSDIDVVTLQKILSIWKSKEILRCLDDRDIMMFPQTIGDIIFYTKQELEWYIKNTQEKKP